MQIAVVLAVGCWRRKMGFGEMLGGILGAGALGIVGVVLGIVGAVRG